MSKLLTSWNMVETPNKMIESTLLNKISPNNACFLLNIMEQCSFEKSKNFDLSFILKWFCYMAEKNQHLELSFDSIEYLISNSGLKVSSEVQTFNAADSWINYKPKEKSKYAVKLIESVRLSLLSQAALHSLLTSENSL